MGVQENAFTLFETGFSLVNGTPDLPSIGENLGLSFYRTSSRAERFFWERFSEIKLELLHQLTVKSLVAGALLTGLQGGGLDLAWGNGIIMCS